MKIFITKLIRDEWHYQDIVKLNNLHLKDEQVVTCRYGTRIDYIHGRSRDPDPWFPSRCSIIDTEAETDQNIAFAEFRLNSIKSVDE